MNTDHQVRARRGNKASSKALDTLTVRPFRRYLLGQLTSNIGTWMQRAAQDLLVLHLSGNSGSAVGVVTALQFLPQTLFGLTGGVLADRFPKRRLLLITQTAMAGQSLLLGLLTVTGAVNLWSVYALALALGAATAVDGPARSAFIAELVSRERVPAAVGLNSAQFNVARILGPAAAGLTVASMGIGPVFLINAVSYMTVLRGLMTVPPGVPREPGGPRRGGPRLTEACRHITATPELLLSITLIAVVGTFGFNFQVTISLVAIKVFHSGAAAFGCLSTAYAAGSLIGAALAAHRGRPPTARRLVTATAVFGVLEATLGLMPGYRTFMALLIPTGYAAVTVTTTANTLTQLRAEPHLRGRVLSMYFLVLLGGTPIGAPLVGLVSDAFGTRSSLILGGVVSTVSALTLPSLIARRRRRDRPQQAAGRIGSPLPDTSQAGTPDRAPATGMGRFTR